MCIPARVRSNTPDTPLAMASDDHGNMELSVVRYMNGMSSPE